MPSTSAHYATDRHRSVDDTPAGGGPAGHAARRAGPRHRSQAPRRPRPRLAMSPARRSAHPERVEALAQGPGAVILCGRFEGVDERVIEARSSRKSRSATMSFRAEKLRRRLLDACVRLLPGVMGKGGLGRGGELCPRPARIPAIYPAPIVGGSADPRCAHLR